MRHFAIPRQGRTLLLAALIALLGAGPALAEPMEVRSSGKDLRTATLNAQVMAVRTAMNEMVGKDFVKAHVKELRGIIANAQKYSGQPAVGTQSAGKGGMVQLTATVDVDRAALASALRALGATIVKSYRETLAERGAIAQRALKALFGDGFALGAVSTPAAAVGGTDPKTEEIVTENYVFGPQGPGIFSPQQHFTVSYHRDDESARNEGLYTVVPASVPLGTFKECVEERENGLRLFRMSGREGLLELMAPPVPGSYEVRLFNAEDGPCVARYGFRVERGQEPRLEADRNVFAPEERMGVRYSGLGEIERAQVVIARAEDANLRMSDMKMVAHTDDLDLVSGEAVELRAPREEGRYSLLLRCSGCHDCSSFYQVHERSHALARLDFTVKKPREDGGFGLLVPPEVVSGTGLYALFSRPQGSEGESWVRIRRAGDAPDADPVQERRFGEAVRGERLGDFHEPGDYTVDLYAKRDDQQPAVSTGLRVLPGAWDERTVPHLEVYYADLEFGSYVHFDYYAKSGWGDSGFIGMVPAGTPLDAPSAYKAAGNHHIGLSARRHGTFDYISTEGLAPGKYELRMYDSYREGGRLQAKAEVQLSSEEETRKKTEEIERQLDELVTDSATVAVPGRGWRHARLELGAGGPPRYRLISEVPREERQRQEIALRQVAMKGACDLDLEKEINYQARLDLTLGRDNSVREELESFGKSVLTEWAVPNGLEKVQTGFKIAFDAVEHGKAGLDAMSEQDYAAAAKEAALFMIKTTLNACSDSDCFLGIISSSEDAASAYFGKLSDEEFFAFMKRQAQRFRLSNGDGKFANTLKTLQEPVRARMKHMTNMALAEMTQKTADFMMNTGSAALGAEGDAGATSAFFSIDEDTGDLQIGAAGAATLAVAEAILRTNPKCAAVISSSRLAYQVALEAKEYVRDSAVTSAYHNWQKFNETDQDWLIKEGGVRGLGKLGQADLLEQVRNIMIKTINSSPMTRAALSEEHLGLIKNRRLACERYGSQSDQCKALKINKSDLTEDEIWNYLKNQFSEWDKLEEGNREYAEFSRGVLEDYKHLDPKCRRNLEDYYNRHLKKREGAGTRLFNALTFSTDQCKDERGMFEAYLGFRSQMEEAYKQVLPEGGRRCDIDNPKNRNGYARESVCHALNYYTRDPKEVVQYMMSTIADDACYCGVSMSVVDGRLYRAGQEPPARMEAIDEQVKRKLTERDRNAQARIRLAQRMAKYDDPHKIGTVMSHIGAKGVLNCLCMRGPGHPAFGGGSFYTGSGKCRSCGVTGHCWYSGMSSSAEDKKLCGYHDVIKDYATMRNAEEALKPLLGEQEIRAQIIEGDNFLQLRRPGQCQVR
ncbi:MAG: hypothetical protein K6A65_07850 [Succinivibrionaceae bacterium]|nr:hypothetical protein [Succinivibrionaceae bacterium]